jgi:hypothetical protein
MAREGYRTLHGDLAKLKDKAGLNDPAAGTGYDDALWQLLASVSDWVDGYCNRHFYPRIETLYFDVPNQSRELEVPDLISVTSLKDDEDQDGTFENTWSSNDYQLYPINAQPTQHWGKPYYQARASMLSSGDHEDGFPPGQKVIEIAGLWGYRRYLEDSGADINEGATFQASDTTLTVTDGTKFSIGQTIYTLTGLTEQMLVTNIATNDLTVVRGLNGTTAGAISNSTNLYILRVPPSVERAALITAARIYTRATTFEPFYVDADVDTDVRLLLEPYRKV